MESPIEYPIHDQLLRLLDSLKEVLLTDRKRLDKLRKGYRLINQDYTEGVINGKTDGNLSRVLILEKIFAEIETLIQIKEAILVPTLSEVVHDTESKLASIIYSNVSGAQVLLQSRINAIFDEGFSIVTVWQNGLSARLKL